MGYSPWGHKESDMSERLHFLSSSRYEGASLMPQMVKNLPAMPWFDPWVGKIPIEEGMATHSGILAWRIPTDRVQVTK